MKRFISFVIIMICFLEGFCQDPSLPMQMLDSFISKAMNDWHTMGVSVAVVKKNSVILAKGYGYRDFANRLAVTENTIFPIASCSKTFASALMGMASDEKKIELNKPVHQYLPQFHLYSDELTKHATIRDLLSHSTGVPGHDWAWTFNTNYPEEVYLKRIRYLEPSVALRTKYQYNSFMFFVLSVLAEKVYNKNWNELVAEKFFRPLEMNSSYGSSAVLKNRDNMSLTYQYRDSFLLEKTNQMDDLLAGGALLSTSTDLAHWLQMWINGGRYKDHRILSGEYARKAITSEIVVGSDINAESIDEPFMNMGLSWFLSSYRGHYKAHHTGNVSGYSSSISFFPYDSLGIVVLANQNGSALIQLIPDFIADLYFDLGVHDKNSAWLMMRKEFEASQKQPATINPDTITKRPLFPFTKYCGEFFNPGYGPVKITPYRNGLLLSYFDLKLVLIPKRTGHIFSSHHLEDSSVSTRGEGDVIFKTDKNGGVQSFSIPFEPEVKDIIFTRKK
jgi:CubicO group peptidase (beta-lactamase class C family)